MPVRPALPCLDVPLGVPWDALAASLLSCWALGCPWGLFCVQNLGPQLGPGGFGTVPGGAALARPDVARCAKQGLARHCVSSISA